MRFAAICLGVIAAVGLFCWWEYSLWAECRATNSFFYCLRVIGR